MWCNRKILWILIHLISCKKKAKKADKPPMRPRTRFQTSKKQFCCTCVPTTSPAWNWIYDLISCSQLLQRDYRKSPCSGKKVVLIFSKDKSKIVQAHEAFCVAEWKVRRKKTTTLRLPCNIGSTVDQNPGKPDLFISVWRWTVSEAPGKPYPKPTTSLELLLEAT